MKTVSYALTGKIEKIRWTDICLRDPDGGLVSDDPCVDIENILRDHHGKIVSISITVQED